eukprot:1392906-Alexandrium_andersonii.AAC.1
MCIRDRVRGQRQGREQREGQEGHRGADRGRAGLGGRAVAAQHALRPGTVFACLTPLRLAYTGERGGVCTVAQGSARLH